MTVLLRCVLFLACVPSGGALLLKVWGLTSMRAGGLIFLACLPAFPLAYRWACRHDSSLACDLRVGCWAGLVGTLGYDVARLPFHLWGVRVFAPIQAYGVWLVGADNSNGWTDAAGWLYHFSNGVTFALMYVLWMGGRHWGWGVLWGLALETIVLSTPFARIFHLQGNSTAIAIAYLGHLAYGLPLGYLVWRREETDLRIAQTADSVKLGAGILLMVFILAGVPGDPVLSANPRPGTLWVHGYRLFPTWVRLPAPGAVLVTNPGSDAVTVLQPSGKRELGLRGGQTGEWTFEQPGIYQCYVQSQGRSVSSFIIVEPVERCP